MTVRSLGKYREYPLMMVVVGDLTKIFAVTQGWRTKKRRKIGGTGQLFKHDGRASDPASLELNSTYLQNLHCLRRSARDFCLPAIFEPVCSHAWHPKIENSLPKSGNIPTEILFFLEHL